MLKHLSYTDSSKRNRFGVYLKSGLLVARVGFEPTSFIFPGYEPGDLTTSPPRNKNKLFLRSEGTTYKTLNSSLDTTVRIIWVTRENRTLDL